MIEKEIYNKVEEFLNAEDKDNIEVKNKKFLHIVDNLHQEVWNLTRNLDQNMTTYITVLVSITAVMIYVLNHNKGQYLFLATVISQCALLWILLITLESGYTYRYLQAISANIERKFGGKTPNCTWHEILPSSYQKPKYGMREIQKIHFGLFGTYFSILPWVFLVYGQPREESWPIGLYFIFLIISSIVFFLFRYFKDNNEEKCKKIKKKKDENCSLFLLIFLPFIVSGFIYLLPRLIKWKLNIEYMTTFLIWVFGIIILFLYNKMRKNNFYKNFPFESEEKSI